MPDKSGKWTFGDYLSAGLEVATIFGGAYLNHKIREQEIDNLLSLPLNKAIQVVVQIVPPMDNETWKEFHLRLQNRSQYSNEAQQLLYLARAIVVAENEVAQLMQFSMADILQIVPGLLQSKDPTEQLAFVVGLNSSNDLKAKSLLGRLLAE